MGFWYYPVPLFTSPDFDNRTEYPSVELVLHFYDGFSGINVNSKQAVQQGLVKDMQSENTVALIEQNLPGYTITVNDVITQKDPSWASDGPVGDALNDGMHFNGRRRGLAGGAGYQHGGHLG